MKQKQIEAAARVLAEMHFDKMGYHEANREAFLEKYSDGWISDATLILKAAQEAEG